MNKNKIALGCVQFGMDYGISNNTGIVSPNEINSILSLSKEYGIDTLDTAIAYGESEIQLGQNNLDDFSVISKLPEYPSDSISVFSWAENQLQNSLTRLGLKKISGLLLHKPEQLLSNDGKALISALQSFRKQGLIDRIGISVYSPDGIEDLLNIIDVDIVQIPFNIFDRRLTESGLMDLLYSRNIAIHVRSVFLQGLLLMPTTERPKKFTQWNSLWEHWDNWLNKNSITPLDACLSYVLSFPKIERVIIGVNTKKQLEEIIISSNISQIIPPNDLACNDVKLINPSFWNIL